MKDLTFEHFLIMILKAGVILATVCPELLKDNKMAERN